MKFLLLLHVEVVDICIVVYGEGSGGGRSHGKEIAKTCYSEIDGLMSGILTKLGGDQMILRSN